MYWRISKYRNTLDERLIYIKLTNKYLILATNLKYTSTHANIFTHNLWFTLLLLTFLLILLTYIAVLVRFGFHTGVYNCIIKSMSFSIWQVSLTFFKMYLYRQRLQLKVKYDNNFVWKCKFRCIKRGVITWLWGLNLCSEFQTLRWCQFEGENKFPLV